MVELTAAQQLQVLRIWELLDLAADGAPRREVQAQLTRLVAADIRPAFDVYVGVIVRDQTDPQGKWTGRDALLKDVLRSIDPEGLFEHLRGVNVEGTAMETRVRSIELAAGSEHPRCLDVTREILESADPVQLMSPLVAKRLEVALRGAFSRHRRALSSVTKDPAALPPHMWPLLVKAAPEGEAGTELLLALIGLNPELDRSILTRLAELARLPGGFGSGHLHTDVVRGSRDLLTHPDRRVREQALLAMGYLVDPDAIPQTINLLEDSEPAVQRVAAWSLKQATGMSLGADPERWGGWYDEQLRWFEQRGLEAERKLMACSDAEAIALIRELAYRPLFRHRITEMLGPVLFRENHFVVNAAITAMAQLKSPAAVELLIDGLGHADPVCRAIIHQALMDLTGFDLPAVQSEWIELFSTSVD